MVATRAFRHSIARIIKLNRNVQNAHNTEMKQIDRECVTPLFLNYSKLQICTVQDNYEIMLDEILTNLLLS